MALLAIATDILAGHLGKIGFGAIFFAAAGGYCFSLSVGRGVVPWAAGLLALAICWIISLLLSHLLYPLDKDAFLLATFALQMGLVDLANNFNVLGGYLGLRNIPSFWPGTLNGPTSALLILLIFGGGATLILGWALHPSHPLGRAFWLLRDDESAAVSDGLPTFSMFQFGFSLQAILGCVAGVSWVVNDSYVGPSTFDLGLSIAVLTVLFISGTGGRAWWIVVGAVFLAGISELLAIFVSNPTLVGPFQRILFNVLLIGVIVFRPRGLAGPKIEEGPGIELQL